MKLSCNYGKVRVTVQVYVCVWLTQQGGRGGEGSEAPVNVPVIFYC